MPPETVLWDPFPQETLQLLTAGRVCRESSASLWVCHRHLEIARLLLTRVEAPKMNPALRVHLEHRVPL